MDKKYKDLKDNFVSFSYYSSQKLKSYSKNLKPAKSMHKMDTQTNLKSFGRNISIIILQNLCIKKGLYKERTWQIENSFIKNKNRFLVLVYIYPFNFFNPSFFFLTLCDICYTFFLLNYDRIVLHTGRFMKTVPSAMSLG